MDPSNKLVEVNSKAYSNGVFTPTETKTKENLTFQKSDVKMVGETGPPNFKIIRSYHFLSPIINPIHTTSNDDRPMNSN
ncbi:hypothetical protein L1987_22247 [Smallanthus sonchifolius]|uniref:Uncharacterized protein n=1 Tax=Smallanthus sonchifolius TaxID=185202 RepID=A0ACB9IDL9_9ASTR|nr:hypothetical protein L1987_22247 [Smallanthus sonchifolius]